MYTDGFFMQIMNAKTFHSICVSLMQEKDVGMDGPLLDNEQYPRADIDLVVVRTSRNKIICE
jgi:hypothetical protein